MKYTLTLLSFVVLAAPACADLFAFDSAADSTYNAGWGNGQNGGFGFMPWQFAGLGPSKGIFVGTSANNGGGAGTPNIDSSGRAWGMWANSGSAVLGQREIATNDRANISHIGLDMDNGWIDQGTVATSPNSVIAGVVSESNQFQIGIAFRGGQNNYDFFTFENNAIAYVDTGIGFTDGGVHMDVNRLSGTSYEVVIKRLSDNATSSYTHSLAVSENMALIGVANYNAGNDGARDAFFNNLQADVVPEPASMTVLALGAAGILARRKRK